jgi:hemerythrin-like domain-containing protein
MTDEHRLILRAIDVLEKCSADLESGKEVRNETFEEIIDVLRNFADACHHGKEEDVLFPMARNLGSSEDQTVAMFLKDHVKGRAFVKGLSDAVERNDRGGIVSNASGYAKILRVHIQKEEAVFVLWIGPLADKEKAKIGKKFEEIERDAIGPRGREKYEESVGRLERSA